ncbi:unnamed protein product [Orchesella dallaii]|uniref:Uncharacterized protein n=1 Tax=Orchesella dallaii TaxID=48710 RepID=A0ABP1RVM1_9HEXA
MAFFHDALVLSQVVSFGHDDLSLTGVVVLLDHNNCNWGDDKCSFLLVCDEVVLRIPHLSRRSGTTSEVDQCALSWPPAPIKLAPAPNTIKLAPSPHPPLS